MRYSKDVAEPVMQFEGRMVRVSAVEHTPSGDVADIQRHEDETDWPYPIDHWREPLENLRSLDSASEPDFDKIDTEEKERLDQIEADRE